MPKDKLGNQLTWKEWFKKWGEGIEGTTPEQKVRIQIGATRITMLGFFLGLVMAVVGYKTLWWLGIILLGGLINTCVTYISLMQQRKGFKQMNSGKKVNLKDFLNSLEEKETKGGKR